MYLESSKESLYKDIAAIKKKFRNRYGVHQYLSIMHTPGSYEEYMKDMIVFQKKSKGLEKNNTIIGSFKCYDKLNKCDIVRLCEKIEKYLNGDYKKIIRERENKQFLVVYKNGVNDSYFMVGILGDYLNYSFGLCYYLAYSINYHTRFPILEIENSRYDITKIMNTFGKYGYRTDVKKGYELL